MMAHIVLHNYFILFFWVESNPFLLFRRSFTQLMLPYTYLIGRERCVFFECILSSKLELQSEVERKLDADNDDKQSDDVPRESYKIKS